MTETWEQSARRIASGEPAEDVLDERMAAERDEFAAFVLTLPDGAAVLARHQARLRDLDLGITGARNAWHSISSAQRAVLIAAATTKKGRIVRRTVKPSVYVRDGGVDLLCRVATVRNLCERDLMAWDGGAFDPEQAAALTERGHFVLRHGRPKELRERTGKRGETQS